jgi:hypothetical protein
MFTIMYNRTTNHIDGFHPKDTKSGEFDYALNACGSLTRYRFARGESFESPLVALNAALKSPRKLCLTCKKNAEAMIAEANKGEKIMAVAERNDVATEQGKAVIEQIDANIERATSLAEAENVEGLAELSVETETLISTLSGKGSTGIKKAKRDEWTAAAQVQARPASKAVEKKNVVEGAPVLTWDQFEGVPELVHLGAAKVAEGVKSHVKTSTLAKDIAAIGLEMWLRIPNKAGVPDLMGDSDPAKKASGALLKEAGEGFADDYDNKQALNKLMRSVQGQRTDVRAEWLRSLDEEGEVQDERRALMAKVLEGKPEDEPASAWVANVYGASLIGQTEKKRLDYQAKKALESGEGIVTPGGESEGGEGEGEGETEEGESTTPDERVAAVAKRLVADIKKANPEDFEHASDETKEKVREQLEEAIKAMRAMVAATL